MIKFPKIGQFRDTVRNVTIASSFVRMDESDQPIYNESLPKPTLPFRGTVKLHGSNGSIVINPDDSFEVQSRNRTLTLGNDNAGFAMFVLGTVGQDTWVELSNNILIHPKVYNKDHRGRGKPVVIYGEWCGGNIQPSVALAGLEKMFVVFGLRLGTDEDIHWVDIKPFGSFGLDDQRIYSIYDERFASYEIDIDFENPGDAQNKMIEITESVEKECPVAKGLGQTGLGEGVVWICMDPDHSDSGYWFKVKGEKHSVSKVKTLVPVDVEKVSSINELVDRVVTENRCLQGIEFLKEQQMDISRKSTGEYIKWITEDILGEELDTIVASGLEPRAIGKPVSVAARKWFFNHLDSLAGISG